MNYTFEEIKEKIFRSFVENGEKKMEGMIYYDRSLNSFYGAEIYVQLF